MKTIIAAFAERENADHAIGQLRATARQAGTPMLIDEPGRSSELFDNLCARGVPPDVSELYAEALRRGAAIVVCEGADDQAQDIAEILDRYKTLDIDKSALRWRSEGWTGYSAEATPFDEELRTREHEAFGGESIPVIEEEMKVGKREMPAEGARVRTFVTERPVQQQVTLTEEKVDVHREPANEPVPAGATEAAFEEGEYVVEAHGEEPVIQKEARVVERVEVAKHAEQRTETIEGTERRRDVEVEPIEPKPAEPRH